VLYNNALRDYTAGKYDLAQQEFNDYLKYYPDTELAGNSQFYLADIMYKQGDYKGAIAAYNVVLERYPDGNKSPAAQLKKAYAYLELGQRTEGVRELNSLVTRYPRSLEAQQAKERLKHLGPASTARSPRG
jgi:tol-pal system protein YbgF